MIDDLLSLNLMIRVVRNPRFWVVVALFLVGIILHYPQQLTFWGGDAPPSFLGLDRHTIERVYLLVPIIYAGFNFGMKGGVVSLALALGIMLPRVILVSPSPTEALVETIGVICVGITVNLFFRAYRKEQEHSRVADALLRAEEEWRSSFNAIQDVMLIINRNQEIEKINDRGLALLGKDREEVIGEKCYRVMWETECPITDCSSRCVIQTKRVESVDRYEERFGRYFSVHSSPMFDESGEVVKIVVLMRDMTEMKRAEEMLVKIIDGSSIALFVIDKHHRVIHWNKAVEVLTGIRREDIIGTDKHWQPFYTEQRPLMADLIVDGASEEEIEEHYQGNCKRFSLIDGAYETEDLYRVPVRGGKWLHFAASPIKDHSGSIIGAIETLQDITERKRAEHDLNERMKELKCLYDIASVAQRPEITLYELYQEVVNLLPASWQYPEDCCARIIINNEEFKTANYQPTEWRQSAVIKIYGKRGGIVEVGYLSEKPERDEGPFLAEERFLINAVAERLTGITDHKRAEKALQESEKSYRELFEGALDAIWVHDLRGNIQKANQASEKLTGFSGEELVRCNIENFLSEESLLLSREVRRQLIKGEPVVQPYEQHLIRKEGTKVPIMLTSSPIFSDDKLVAFQDIARDISEQKRLEENLHYYLQQITRAQEEERKRIARELHDSTVQNLIAMLHKLENLLGDKAELPVKEAKALWSFYEQIRDVLWEVRRFCRDLRPSILDDLGLRPALEWLAGELQKEYGIATSLEIAGDERRFSPEAELVLFRVVQEALSNVAKHAQATKAEVKIEYEEQRVRVTIADDGVGFQLPESLGDLPYSGKLGLAGMEERMRLLNGNMEIASEIAKGTTIVADVPI